ncbi:MAG: tetraacyldisaccharide 4'-kinase [Burkholderiales bacterium]
MAFPERHWYRFSLLSALLAPAAMAFDAFVRLRRAAYEAGILRQVRIRVPVVVVGNLVVGGTGKTPLVLWLAAALVKRGWRPGIVSRGHGAGATHVRAVPVCGDPHEFGDEPLLHAERSGCPVWVGRDRAAAAAALLAAHPECDVIICDDGLQHYALARDFEIAVRDERGAGNGLLLPAGPLREPVGRPVDAWAVNGAAAAPGEFAMRLVAAGFRRVASPEAEVPLAELEGKRLHAVAGIGNPRRFFAQLESMGLATQSHAFPDHHPFRAEELAFPGSDYILMTEKDAVKCRAFENDRLLALRVNAVVDARLADQVERRIRGLPAA